MAPLRLKAWDIAYARQKVPELQEPKPNFACWVGSVSIDDMSRFSDFISKAKQGDVMSLTQFQQVGGNLAYAILLNLPGDQWKLVVIKSPDDPGLNEQAIFASIVHLGISIDVYQEQMTSVERRLREDCNLRFRDILKEWLRFRS